MSPFELLVVLAVGFAVGQVFRRRQSASSTAASADAPVAPPAAVEAARPGALGAVPLGGFFACNELKALGYHSAKLLSVVGGPRAPAVVDTSLVRGPQMDMLRQMHSAGSVYGLELMQFVHHTAPLDLRQETLVFADVGPRHGTIALLVRDRPGAVRAIPSGA